MVDDLLLTMDSVACRGPIVSCMSATPESKRRLLLSGSFTQWQGTLFNRKAELSQGLVLNLPHTLLGQADQLADLGECARSLVPEACCISGSNSEAVVNHFTLDICQSSMIAKNNMLYFICAIEKLFGSAFGREV